MSTAEHIAFTGTGSAYDPETGEALVYGRADTHKVVSIAQYDSHSKRQDFIGRQAEFTFADMHELHEIIDVLTTAQCGYLLLLQCYVDFDNGKLVNAKGDAMKTAEILEVLRLKRKRQTFYDFMGKCEENSIITRDDDGVYYVNPRYHFRGATNNRSVVRTYSTMIKRSYRENKAADLGLIYRMLQFVHFESNALCANPFERDARCIRWFNVKQLAEAIGVHEKTLSKRLPAINVGGVPIVARVKVQGEAGKFVFNPFVFYRSTKEPSALLIAMFNGEAA
ncbi:hypothetical protein [Paenibacillus sp. ACRRY]|uniref:hypothetical protein n=1 Tax=Paenibacillus sp. ACRRY TaxID=2918208 RepID=UPI001EF72908|nr:hypothetical protein [Paenibacillus sp. ACRRY]MCG7383388.1 hypothetical protein [Paenibacillus sp. ACRRY]